MRRLGVLVTGVLLMISGTANAQDNAKGEYSGGWRYYHATLTGARSVELKVPNDFAKGWYGDAAFNLSPKFAIVGEAGGTYHSDELNKTSGSVTTHETLDISFHTFAGGVRVRAPQNPAIIPFGQVLFGGEHNTSTDERSLKFSSNTSTGTYEGGGSGAVLALDGGVTIKAGPVGLRSAVGYARFFGKADSDAFRLSVGAAFRF